MSTAIEHFEWQFLTNDAREDEGLAHAGIETFRGMQFSSLARECAQNSLDAACRRGDLPGEPVELHIRLEHIKTRDVPGVRSLKRSIEACFNKAASKNLKKEEAFFKHALGLLESQTLPILLIEDFGTTGLGDASEGGAFHALVKSSGVSQKAHDDAGGSFGIGKNAVFANSSLRTAFYSSLSKKNNIRYELFQGKSILVSHSADSMPKRATGFFGAEQFGPLLSHTGLPDWLRREKAGTTIGCLGFKEAENWQWQMIASITTSFFAAIHRDAIRFSVSWGPNDSVSIDKSSLPDIFASPDVRDAADENGFLEDLQYGASMYAALKSDDAEVQTRTFPTIGDIELRILQAEGMPRKVGILRNGMVIADNLKSFGQSFSRFSMCRDFICVVEPSGAQASSVLREMESPRHDEISVERVDEPGRQRKLRAEMKALATWIRDTIKSSTTSQSESVIALDELNEFFAAPGDPENTNDAGDAERNPVEIFVRGPNQTHPPKTGRGNDGDSGSAGGKRRNDRTGGTSSGDRMGHGHGSVGGRGGRAIPYSSARTALSSTGTDRKRFIAFTPDRDGLATLEIFSPGISGEETLSLTKFGDIVCTKPPKLKLKKGVRFSVEVEFDRPYAGPITFDLLAESEN